MQELHNVKGSRKNGIYVVTSDKARFLALMPILRSKLAALKVRFNEGKFYMQHYSKGVMMLGTRLVWCRQD